MPKSRFLNAFLEFIKNPKYIFGIYFVVAGVSALSKFLRGPQAYNNYLIFKNVFYHALNGQGLFSEYPLDYFDTNHYGIFFSLLIAPFALLPDGVGIVLWNLCNAGIFLFAVSKLPFNKAYLSYFLWLCLQEFITASVSLQFNIALTGLIILSALYIHQQKETHSSAAILIGAFVKLYGIVGWSSFFFVKHKKRFFLSFLALGIVFFLLPAMWSGFGFNLQSYMDWYGSLVEKNSSNSSLNSYQDISVMGLFRRLTGNPALPNLYFYALGLPLFLLPYVRIDQYRHLAFRMMILASTLIFVVLFSSSSESPTYIIAVAGVMLWFLMQKEKKGLVVILLILVILLTSFSASDLFPRYVKDNFIIKYSLKSLPCVLVWLRVTYELLIKNFETDYRL